MKYNLLDTITIISFLVGLQNLDLNITQEDVQNVASQMDTRLESLVNDIHEHLAVQDVKLSTILDRLEAKA